MSVRYAPVRFLAAGGMAEVFLARQIHADSVERTVVIKRVLKHLAREREFLDLFASEARLAVKLRHPNIVQILDAGTEEGVPFIAMEALFGADLRALIQETRTRGNRFDPGTACAIAADIARGLHYAHTLTTREGAPLRIVHRDISPHNVFVTRDGHTKILDFGIAKSAEQLTSTRTGTMKGKPGYMSPEQIKGGAIDARTDVFALGVVLWETLACRRLFRGADIAAAMATMEQEAPPIGSIVPGVPPRIERLLNAMLCKKPEGRPGDAGIVVRELEAAMRELGCVQPALAVAHVVNELAPAPEDEFAGETAIAVGEIGEIHPDSEPGEFAPFGSEPALQDEPVTALAATRSAASIVRPARTRLWVGASIAALVAIGGASFGGWWLARSSIESTSRAAAPGSPVPQAEGRPPIAPVAPPAAPAVVASPAIAEAPPVAAPVAPARPNAHGRHSTSTHRATTTAAQPRLIPAGASFRQ